MYALYFNLLRYTCIMYGVLVLMSFLNVVVNWLALSDEILANYFYGFNNNTQKYLTLLYLPDFNIKSQTQVIVSQIFFLFYNVMIYGAFTLTFINLEKDLELVYIDPGNSEISLFSLYFDNIPKDKYVEFERLIVKHLDHSGNRDTLLNISHVFDLRAYFHYVKNSKNHYFYKHLYQQPEVGRQTILPGKSRLSFRKSSFAPRPDMIHATADDIKIARRIRLMSEEEKKEEDKRLDKLKKVKIKELVQKIKAEDRFFYNITKIQEKIKEKKNDLYLGGTFVSFKSLDMCVIFLRMFESYLQKEVLADANDPQFGYLTKIRARIAPFIDDLRWEHMFKYRIYYVTEILFVLTVSSVNMLIEKMYNQKNLHELIVNRRTLSDPYWLLPLLLLLTLQVLLSVISVVCLEKLIGRHTFYKRSKKIEINFFFFNFFMLLNNIMVVFYGFLWAAAELGPTISEDKKYYFNFFINFQWIKNSLIIIFLPLTQRLIGDYLIKWHLIPWISKKCRTKKKEAPHPDITKDIRDPNDSAAERDQPSGNLAALIDGEQEVPPVNQEAELEAVNQEINPDDYSSQSEETESSHGPEDDEEIPQKKKPVHDFGLNSSYLIQVCFFSGFYLSFTSPLLQLVIMLGVWLNYKFEDRLLRTVYDKTRYVSISNLFVTLRWGFVAFCFGIVMSVSNSKLYMYIINSKSSELNAISKLSGFQNMIGFCNFAISLIFFSQMATSKIMFRVLNSIDTLKRKFGGSFFKLEFEKVNYKSQNPFYCF